MVDEEVPCKELLSVLTDSKDTRIVKKSINLAMLFFYIGNELVNGRGFLEIENKIGDLFGLFLPVISSNFFDGCFCSLFAAGGYDHLGVFSSLEDVFHGSVTDSLVCTGYKHRSVGPVVWRVRLFHSQLFNLVKFIVQGL